jgi:phosphoribosylpyrophosphate synthetase
MWFIAGTNSVLHLSLSSCLQRSQIPFASIRTTQYPDGEMQFHWAPQTGGLPHVLLQLPSSSDTYLSALSLSRELQSKFNQSTPELPYDLVVCLPYMPYARNPYLLNAMLDDSYASVLGGDVVTTGLPKTPSLPPTNPMTPRVLFVSLDVHNSTDTRLHNLYPVALFASQVHTFAQMFNRCERNCFVLAPDEGAKWRAGQLATELNVPVVFAKKARLPNNSCMVGLADDDSAGGAISRECLSARDCCIIVDDIVASGQTLRAAVLCARNLGAKHIIAVITHTLVAPNEQLLHEIDTWITTNTFDNSFNAVIVDIASFLISEIDKLTRGKA